MRQKDKCAAILRAFFLHGSSVFLWHCCGRVIS